MWDIQASKDGKVWLKGFLFNLFFFFYMRSDIFYLFFIFYFFLIFHSSFLVSSILFP